MLFIDYSVHLHTPLTPTTRLNHLGLNNHLCNWVDNFLPGKTSSPSSHQTQEHHRAVCWALSSSPSTHTHNSKPCYEPNTIKFFGWCCCGWQNDCQQRVRLQSRGWEPGVEKITWSSHAENMKEMIKTAQRTTGSELPRTFADSL